MAQWLVTDIGQATKQVRGVIEPRQVELAQINVRVIAAGRVAVVVVVVVAVLVGVHLLAVGLDLGHLVRLHVRREVILVEGQQASVGRLRQWLDSAARLVFALAMLVLWALLVRGCDR